MSNALEMFRRVCALAGCCSALVVPVFAQSLTESPHNLMKDVVYNELQDRHRESFWQYRIEKRVGEQSVTEQQIDTRFGPIHRVLARNGVPLTPAQQQEEDQRLQGLLSRPSEQAKLRQEHDADEDRLERLMQSMADAFLFTDEGSDGGNIRLAFRPNPDYVPPTYEARVFHALAGEVWVNAQYKRMVRVKGQTIDRVDFGYGLFGRVDKGGTFELQREPVAPMHWRMRLLELHLSGRMILFKSLNREEREVRSNFEPVPADTSLQQAVVLLAASSHAEQAKPADRVARSGLEGDVVVGDLGPGEVVRRCR